MGQKNQKSNEGEGKKDNGGGSSSDVTVVLKTDLHCEGCASKLVKSIRSFDGVEFVTIGDGQKIAVVGDVDPAELRERVERKTHKKVEIVSASQRLKTSDGKAKQEKKAEAKETKSNDKSDQKKTKEKEPPVTTAVLKVKLHCEGCIQKIIKTVSKTKGYEDMKIDNQKDLVIVTGAMDMKALAEVLQKQLKKDVEIVPAKKADEKKEKGGGGGDKAKDGGDEGKMEIGNRVPLPPQMFGYPHPYPYPYPYPVMNRPGFGDHHHPAGQFQYNPYAVGPHHAPQMFSDENPNACRVM